MGIDDADDFQALLDGTMGIIADDLKDYAITDMLDDGLIVAVEGVYRVTDLGRAQLEEWRRNST